MKKRALSLALALVMALSLLPTASLAAGQKYDDTQGHWAESAIERWSGYKIVEGDDGHFHPNRSLTRGEMAKILANTLGLTDEGDKNPFADVDPSAWYTPFVLRCAAAGIMEGDGVNAHPTDVITRQETMTVLGRALNIEPVKDADLSAYADGSTVADWAKGYVAAMTKAGVIKGIGENLLAPTQDVTRASIMAILDRSVAEYINASGTYDLTGKEGLVLVAAGNVTFTGKSAAHILVTAAATGKELTFDKAEITGSITVQADNAKVVSKNGATLPKIVALGKNIKTETIAPKPSRRPSSSGGGSSSPSYSNLTIAESKTVDENKTYRDVTITDAVGDGTVTLANMTILGNLYINGGGAHTVNLTNVVIKGKIIMAKVGGETPRLNLVNTPVNTVEVERPATIQADAASTVSAVQARASVYAIGSDTVITAVTVPAGVKEKVYVVANDTAVVEVVNAKSETAVSGTTNSVKEVVAEAPVTVTADAVEKVEVPATAPESVTVAVTGAGSVEVAVNSEKGAAITTEADEQGNKATVDVSTKLDTPPTVTVDGEQKHIHQWGAWEKVDDTTHKRVCKGDETHIETAAHTLGEWVKVDETSHKKTCSVCGGEVTAAHTVVVDPAVAADCLNPGKTEGKHCSDCNAVLTAQEVVAALGHDFTGAYLSDAEGHWHKCTRCDKTDEKAAHTYPAGASCDSATNCTVCNYEKPAGQHTWDEGKVTTEPTCTEKGVKTFTCSVCKQTRTEDVDALGHDWGEWAKEDDTNHKRVCKRDATHTETEAHTWDVGVVTKEPTETEEGVKTYTCSVCKGTKTEAVPVVSGECTLGTPELKTDGSKVWVEATVENLPADAKVGIWISSNSTSPSVTLGRSSKYFVLDGNNLKCYLDQTISTQFLGGTLALSVIDTDIKTAYTTKTLTPATPTNSEEILAATKAEDGASITVSKQDGSKFEDKGVYGCTLTVPDIAYTCKAYFDSLTADGAIKFKDYNNYVPTATGVTVYQAIPTENENGVTVDFIQYSETTFTTP